MVGAVEALSAARDLDEIIPIVLDAARGLSGADGVCFVLRDGKHCHYVDEAAIAPLWKGRRFPLSACISGWCMLNRRTAVIPDIFEDGRIPLDAYRPTFVKSLVMTPVGAEPIAAIGVYWARQQQPDPATVAILETLARATATALASATRHQALSKRVDELAALYRLTDRLYRAESAKDVHEAALDAIGEALGCSRASILLFDDAGVMRFAAWRGLSDGYRKAVDGHTPWKPGDRDPVPVLVEDIDLADESKSLKAVVRAEGIRALAFIPLVAKGGVIGKFMTYYETPHAFSEAEVNLAVTIALQLGFSLQRMRAEQARQIAEEALRRNQDMLQLATQTGKVGLWDWDIPADHVTWTDSLYAMHGIPGTDFEPTAGGFLRLVHDEDRDRLAEAIDRALRDDVPYELEFRAVRPDGQVIWLFTNAIVLRGHDGPARMVGATFDITEHKQAEERFRLAVEAAPSGMVLADAEGRILLVNAHAEKIFGYRRDELIGRPVEMLVPERFRGTHAGFRKMFHGAPVARPMGAGRDLYALRKDGGEVPVEIGLSPITTNDGLLVLSAIVDISERKRTEAQRELLLAELSHRVNNTLAVVQGIAYQTLRGSEVATAIRKTFEGRLAALAAAHKLLAQANWTRSSLRQLAGDALRASGADERRISLDGPEVHLEPRQALALGMALHELSTNAMKYGALSNDVGSIDVLWSRSDGPDPRLRLRWRERAGPPVSQPQHRGFGLRMIEQALAQELEGVVAVVFRPEGFVCTIEAPLSGSGQSAT